MDDVRTVEASRNSTPECCVPAGKSTWLKSHRLLIAIAIAGGVGAVFFSRDWLVAAGVASIIVAMAPCLVMCALGLCMSRHNKGDNAAPGMATATRSLEVQRTIEAEDPK